MRVILIVFISLLFTACKKDSPKPPEAALLIFPQQNSLCTTGVTITPSTSRVEFAWQTANNTENYELRVTNLNSGITQTANTQFTTAELTIDKGTPYSWSVITSNTKVPETSSSTVWQFFNAGSQITHTPFPAQIVGPLSGTSVVRDINQEITLEWLGADVDDDIVGYEIFVDTVSPPLVLAASPAATVSSIKINTNSDTVYFWKVITRDNEGNSSDSGIYSFRAL
ncbi:hypothetical protein [uncultured Eudoraea sp.]|uniref:hypothetical protein n=1 Tax=uncultured Eudoraea sp. TaxID=1035614 RepID=UPI00261AD55B|nr:hypothetical protein [uncultured Eudoraea sp.]